MIDHLIHLYARGGEPFRSLSYLPDAEAIELMRGMYRAGSVYWDRFEDPAQYLQARRQVEQWLRREFIAKGGKPKEPYPIYMVLGRTAWMKTAINELTAATTMQIETPLALFTADDISFTYPDSMVSAMLAGERNPAYYLPEMHGRLFTLPEILALLQERGLPGETWGNNLPSGWANYIEAQVWNREPLLAYLPQTRAQPRI
jgi:hypothetical protein